jgi:ABC-2 type transport system ATP-binding protein
MIQATGLSKHYGATQALNEVSFTIAEHEVVGLLGPNGAGKTTLMKILTGFLQPTLGTATIGGLNVVEDPLAVQSLIGYLPENAPLYPDMLVQEYLQMMADLRELPADHKAPLISDAVRRTGLEDFLVRPIGELSKGYRQRVGLAQAILHQPKVLILDEPTSGLDPMQIVEIRRLIHRLAKNATVLLSTHILSEVELTCERVLIIINGKMQTDARLEDLRTSKGAVVAVESSATGVEETLRSITGVTEVVRAKPQNGYQTYRIAAERSDLCPAIFDVVRQKGWRIAELRPDRMTLESIFRNLNERSGAAA